MKPLYIRLNWLTTWQGFGETCQFESLGVANSARWIVAVSVDDHQRTLTIGPFGYYRGARWLHSMRFRRSPNPEGWPQSIAFQSLGQALPGNDKITELWDGVALTESEEFVTRTLNLVTGPELERLAAIGDSSGPRGRRRRVVAKLKSRAQPVPLKRLGDGVQRLLGIALALSNCQNGILLIDEVENGIHYSILRKLWALIFQAAHDRNIQVIAATHSWDCIASFAHAANATDEVGALIRLEGAEDGPYPVYYSEQELKIAAGQRIEVR